MAPQAVLPFDEQLLLRKCTPNGPSCTRAFRTILSWGVQLIGASSNLRGTYNEELKLAHVRKMLVPLFSETATFRQPNHHEQLANTPRSGIAREGLVVPVRCHHAHTPSYIPVCICVYIYIPMANMYVCVCICLHTQIFMHVHIYTHIYMYTCICIHTCARLAHR